MAKRHRRHSHSTPRKRTSWSFPRWVKWIILATIIIAFVASIVVVKPSSHKHHIKRGKISVISSVDIDIDRYPILGIDISKYNEQIDFEEVANSGITFVYVKASEGANAQDARFNEFIDKAQQADLYVGPYHFFNLNRDGKSQAENFLKAIEGKEYDLPAVIDVEVPDKGTNASPEAVIQNIKVMSDILKNNGYQVMFYTNIKGFDLWLKGHFSHDWLWLCAFKQPEKLQQYRHSIQQFNHHGKVKGIKGEVDLDVFNGTADEWDQWISKVND